MIKTTKNRAKYILTLLVLACGPNLFGATITNTVGGFGLPWSGGKQMYLLEGSVDLSEVTVASNDTVQVINIPANCKVLSVQYTVDTATSTNNVVTFDVGDGSDADGWIADASSTNTALGWVDSTLALVFTGTNVVTATGYTEGKLYKADDTIDLHFDDNPGSTGVIKVSAFVVPVTRD
jgi:hypothetical protein